MDLLFASTQMVGNVFLPSTGQKYGIVTFGCMNPKCYEYEVQAKKMVGKVLRPTVVGCVRGWRGWGSDDETEEVVCNLGNVSRHVMLLR